MTTTAKPTCCVIGCQRSGKLVFGMCQMHYARKRRSGDPLVTKRCTPGSLLNWLLRHVSYHGDECIRWPYAHRPDGYPAGAKHSGKRMSGHRVMCILAHGEPPTERHEAAHSCGNGSKGCLNPNHLRWATPVENHKDKVAHGTLSFGSQHYAAKLTDESIAQILMDTREQKAIARDYGVSQSTVSLVKSGKRWRHLAHATQN